MKHYFVKFEHEGIIYWGRERAFSLKGAIKKAKKRLVKI